MRTWNDIKVVLHISWDKVGLWQLQAKPISVSWKAKSSPGAVWNPLALQPHAHDSPQLTMLLRSAPSLSPHTPCVLPLHRPGPGHPLPPPETTAPSPSQVLAQSSPSTEGSPDSSLLKTANTWLSPWDSLSPPHILSVLFKCLVCLPLLECKGQDGKDFCLF